jgi:hypothetical protein
MRKSKWIDRQVDEALLTVSTVTGMMYARRRARRVMPKVALGTAVVVGVGAAAVVAATGLGVLGVGGAAAWYQRRSKSAAPADSWQAPPAPVRSSFVDADPLEAAPAPTAGE